NGRDKDGVVEGMEGRLDFISQVYAQWRTPESRTHFLSRDAITPVSLSNAYVGPILRIKEINLYNSGVDQVGSLGNGESTRSFDF
ncbi:hypothetical protein ALC57_01889, partial [Trachymyrmex cornetzi]